MDLQAALHTIAEVAVTLAGFSGVVIVFNAARKNWGAREIASLAVMLRASFIAMFLSFLPILIWQLGYEEAVWRMSAGIIASVQTFSIGLFLWHTQWVSASISQKANTIVGVAVVVITTCAAIAVLPNPAFVVILALLWSIYIATHNFWLLLKVGLREDV
jgi:hypothetical protein